MVKHIQKQLAWLREEKEIERTITSRIDNDQEIFTDRIRMLESIEQSLMHYSTVFNPPKSNRDWIIIGIVFGAITAVMAIIMMLTIFQHVKCPCL